ncbi:3-hydroxyacyl-ACP dehydratase FabZ [bacterium]|nr:3-hydroxyacyl-ACP dehydratase FabZ [bacterium]
MDIVQIMEYLPHRPPFLLVDKLLSSSGVSCAKGVKYLSAGDFFFDGHFPGKPQMPKSLLLEVIAQAGAAGVLSAPEYKGKYILFASIDKCHFGRAPVPGDILEVSTELVSMKRGMGKIKASCSVGEEKLAEGLFTFALSDTAQG